MSTAARDPLAHGNAYNIFLSVTTIVSLVVMARAAGADQRRAGDAGERR
jgi:hypothetical protein